MLQGRVSSSRMFRRNAATYRTLSGVPLASTTLPSTGIPSVRQVDSLLCGAFCWLGNLRRSPSVHHQHLVSFRLLPSSWGELPSWCHAFFSAFWDAEEDSPTSAQTGCPFQVPQHLSISPTPFSLSLRTPRTFPTTRSRGSPPWLFPGLVTCFQVCFISPAAWNSFQPVSGRSSSISGLSHIPEVCLKYQQVLSSHCTENASEGGAPPPQRLNEQDVSLCIVS